MDQIREWLPKKSPNVPVACVAMSVAICSTLQTADGTLRVVDRHILSRVFHIA